MNYRLKITSLRVRVAALLGKPPSTPRKVRGKGFFSVLFFYFSLNIFKSECKDF